MRVRVFVYAGVAFCIFLLPLVCLCQFVPGQAGKAPYLLLFPRAHTATAPTLTDDQLIDQALATGQAVSVTDEGDVTLGYSGPAPAATPGTNLARPGTPPE